MRILCATDLLPESEAAVERAGMMARQRGARLCIVHVLASERDERKARIALVHLEKRLRATLGKDGIAPSILLRCGNRASQLIRVVQQVAPDLIVLGARRRRSVRARLGETLAERIQSAHRCPLLIVKHRPAGNYRNILLALDLSSAAREIIRTAQSIVLESGVNTSVVHAFEPHYGTLPYVPRGMESVGAANSPERAEAERAVRRLLGDPGDGLIDSNLILSAAFPAEAIVSSVKRVQSDLLVMGTVGHGRFRRALLGSTASQVLEAVACDVLLAPRGATQESRERARSELAPDRTVGAVSTHRRLRTRARGRSRAPTGEKRVRETRTFAQIISNGPHYRGAVEVTTRRRITHAHK